MRRINEEMNALHRNDIILMFYILYDVKYKLQRLAVRKDLLRWLCTSVLILK